MNNENDLSDEELDKREKLAQNPENKTKDKYDLLEDLRVLLNSSKVEQMKYFHTNSSFGRDCSYYKKSKLLFEQLEKDQVLELMKKILEEK